MPVCSPAAVWLPESSITCIEASCTTVLDYHHTNASSSPSLPVARLPADVSGHSCAQYNPAGHPDIPDDCDVALACFLNAESVSPELLLHVQFLAWDTFARRRVDMIGRKDKGDTVIAHEFDYEIEKQVHNALPARAHSPLTVVQISQCTVQVATQSSILQLTCCI